MTITILITSDLHGRLDRFEQLFHQMKSLKADLVIDNGDFLDGSPASFYYKHISNNEIHPMITLANELYDVAVYGNHEFNDHLPKIKKLHSQFLFPWISCNIGDFSKPYYTKIIRGRKFIVIGATTHFTSLWDEHGYLTELSFQSALKSIQHWITFIKTNEKPDYLIVAYHGGFSEDPLTGAIFQERIGENEANEILELTEGIDLLITGHQHLYINNTIQQTLTVQPASHGKGFIEIQVNFHGETKHSNGKFHPLKADHTSYPSEVERWLEEEITYIEKDYTYEGLLKARLTSHPYIQLLHDMQIKATGAQISVCDLAFLEKGGFKGRITNRDIVFNTREHTLKVISLFGFEIKQLIESSAAVFALNKEGKIDFRTNVYPKTPQPYQYDFWGGLSYTIDIRNPVGKRVKDITFEGEPLIDESAYEVVLNSYRLTGYDFPLLKNRDILYETACTVPFLLKDYLKNDMPIDVPQHGSFKVIY